MLQPHIEVKISAIVGIPLEFPSLPEYVGISKKYQLRYDYGMSDQKCLVDIMRIVAKF